MTDPCHATIYQHSCSSFYVRQQIQCSSAKWVSTGTVPLLTHALLMWRTCANEEWYYMTKFDEKGRTKQGIGVIPKDVMPVSCRRSLDGGGRLAG